MCSVVPFCPLCGFTKFTVVDNALVPTLTVGMQAIGPGDSQALVHQALGADSLRSGPRTAVVVHLDPLRELWRQLILWPGPTPVCTCPQTPQLLKPDTSQLQEHLLSFHMFCSC